MKKRLQVFILIVSVTFSTLSQNNNYYKKGDTLYYSNNRATYLKTNTFVIIKNVNASENLYEVEKYVYSPKLKKNVKESKFITSGLQILRANGEFVSYYENGGKASEGKVVNGKRGTGIWTSYYDNGQKKSEEKLGEGSFFNDEAKNELISFWDRDGKQLVEKGTGEVLYTEKDGLKYKGTYKKGVKSGTWIVYKGEEKIQEEYFKHGKLVEGTAFLSSGEEITYKKIKTPAFYKKEDDSAIKKYFDRNLDSSNFGAYGDVSVSFKVTKEGTIKNPQIIKGLTPEFNSAFKEKLTKMENWTPATNRGSNVNSTYVLSLRFTR